MIKNFVNTILKTAHNDHLQLISTQDIWYIDLKRPIMDVYEIDHDSK